jgi:hypothetical protein
MCFICIGRDNTGCTNSNLLANCLTLLLDKHTDVNVNISHIASAIRLSEDDKEDEYGSFTCLHLLASTWQYEACNVLLKHNARMGMIAAIPFASRLPNQSSKYHKHDINWDSTIIGHSPLHVAALGKPMKYLIGEGTLMINYLLHTTPHSEIMNLIKHRSKESITRPARWLLEKDVKPNCEEGKYK